MANRIKEMRKKKGLSQKEFAKAFNEFAPNIKNVSYATISRWENGKNEPKLNTWLKLSDFFGVPISYLQGIDNQSRFLDTIKGSDHWSSEIVQGMSDRLTHDFVQSLQYSLSIENKALLVRVFSNTSALITKMVPSSPNEKIKKEELNQFSKIIDWLFYKAIGKEPMFASPSVYETATVNDDELIKTLKAINEFLETQPFKTDDKADKSNKK